MKKLAKSMEGGTTIGQSSLRKGWFNERSQQSVNVREASRDTRRGTLKASDDSEMCRGAPLASN